MRHYLRGSFNPNISSTVVILQVSIDPFNAASLAKALVGARGLQDLIDFGATPIEILAGQITQHMAHTPGDAGVVVDTLAR